MHSPTLRSLALILGYRPRLTGDMWLRLRLRPNFNTISKANPWRFFALALSISWFFWMWVIIVRLECLEIKESGLHLGVYTRGAASPVHGLRTSSVPQEPDSGLAVVAGEGHEFGEDRGFLLPACPQIPGPPGLHQLRYTRPGHRFLL